MSDDTKTREWWIEFESPHDGEATVFCEKVDGLDENATHVVEYTAYDKLKAENELLRASYISSKDDCHYWTPEGWKEFQDTKAEQHEMVDKFQQYAVTLNEAAKERDQLRARLSKQLESTVEWKDQAQIYLDERNSARAENIKLKEQLSLHSVFAALPFQEANDKLREEIGLFERDNSVLKERLVELRREVERLTADQKLHYPNTASLHDELASARAEVERLKVEVHQLKHDDPYFEDNVRLVENLASTREELERVSNVSAERFQTLYNREIQINELKDKVARLVEALEYYTHLDHYVKRETLSGTRQEGVLTDGGRTAREALAAHEKGE